MTYKQVRYHTRVLSEQKYQHQKRNNQINYGRIKSPHTLGFQRFTQPFGGQKE